MPSSAVLNVEALLKPISEDNPAGESVRYSGIYDAIQEARRADDDLPVGEWQREAKAADWRAVISLASDALVTKTKDLQLCIWLVEALTKRHGFAGLRDGLSVVRKLHDQFWERFYPEIEDGDVEFRAGPLNWLNEKFPPSIRDIALTGGDPAYSWNHWDESRKVDNLGRQNPEAMQAAIAEGKITGAQFDKAIEATDRSFYENLFEDVAQAKEQLNNLEKIVDEKFGPNAPSLIKVRSAVDDCHQVIGGIVKIKREQDPTYKPNPDSTTAKAAIPPVGRAVGANIDTQQDNGSTPRFVTTSFSGEPRSREEAFQQLAVIAAYLKRVEPQHPVSYLLERAVRWTKMPLEEWLGEVVRNEEVLHHLRDTLGIKE